MSKRYSLNLVVVILLAACVVLPFAATAASGADSTMLFAGAGLASCYFSADDKELGLERTIRAGDAALVSVGLAELIKQNVDVGGDSEFSHSFPSAHSAGAFAIATSLSHIHPKRKWLYYATAALLAANIAIDGKHSWADVAGGAVLGIAIGNSSLKEQNGMLIGVTRRF